MLGIGRENEGEEKKERLFRGILDEIKIYGNINNINIVLSKKRG